MDPVHNLRLAINLLYSCWWMMDAEQREMTLRLQDRFESVHGIADYDWRKEMREEEEDEEKRREMRVAMARIILERKVGDGAVPPGAITFYDGDATEQT